jgi:serine protease Do
MRHAFSIALLAILFTAPIRAGDPFSDVSEQVNQKMVKLFGSGGFRGIASYASGFLISPDGHILTNASQSIDTSEIIVHLYDGRRMKATLVVAEPELDLAMLKIKVEGKKLDEPTGLDLPYFDLLEAAKRPRPGPGTWVLSFANQFEIAMRDEPVSIQRGVIAANTKLFGKRGIFDFQYTGDVYVVDAITNNPGSGGGALTDRKGNLLGIVGRELKNSLSETWINYAVPVNAKVDIRDGEKVRSISVPEFVTLAMKGQYKPVQRPEQISGPGGYHGIEFVPNVVERTPPYVESITPGSPAAKAGVQINDLVSFVDGEPIYSIKSFQDYMKKTRPGMTVRLEVRRGETLQTVEVKLDDYPKNFPGPVPPKSDKK